MQYIMKEKLLKDFNEALKMNKMIYLHGATGFGKTIFLKNALRNIPHAYFSLKDNLNSIECSEKVCVIDDFQFIIDNTHLLKGIERIAESDTTLIISSRSRVDHYFLIPNSLKGSLEIKENDLGLTKEEVFPLFSSLGLKEEMVGQFVEYFAGCNLAIGLLYDRLAKGEAYDMELNRRLALDYCEHLKTNVFEYLDKSVLTFLVQMSVVDDFTIDLANAVTLSDNTKYLVNKAICYGNFISVKNGVYTIRDVMLYALREKSYLYYSEVEYNDYIYNAGVYYETHGDITRALDLYSRCNAISRIKSILIENSRKSPEQGNYVELEKYYRMLEEEDLNAYPILLAGLAMSYAISMDSKKSDFYYDRLKAAALTTKGAERRVLESWVKYLYIALPQTGTIDIFEFLSSSHEEALKGNLMPSTFSLTSNLPSILDGGKDFIPYIKNSDEFMKKYGDVCAFSMGPTGSLGLLSTIFAELYYEKGQYNKAFAILAKAQMESERDNPLIYFVTVKIEAMMALMNGYDTQSIDIVMKFMNRAKEMDNIYVYYNARALYTLLNVYQKNDSYLEEWLFETPDERQSFFTTYRYIFLVKTIVYIYFKRYENALLLLGKLEFYANMYKRSYLDIEIKLLRSIIYFLTDKEYTDELTYALNKAEEYNLITVIALFGAPVYEMIKATRKKLECESKDSSWFEQMWDSLSNMKSKYPDFLFSSESLIPSLSEKGLHIIRLQAQGLSLNQIAERLNENLETIRYHAKQNYKKLGASGKADAVMLAKKNNLI